MNKIKCSVCGEKAKWFFIHDGQCYCDECKNDIINDFEPIEKREKETKYGFIVPNKFIKKQRKRIDEVFYLDTIRKQTAKEIFKEIWKRYKLNEKEIAQGNMNYENAWKEFYCAVEDIEKQFLGGDNHERT